MGSKTQALVILGSGLAGVPLAHHVLRLTSPKVPDLRVILVSPNTEYYWSLASPRAIVSEEFSDKLFEPLAPAFEKYGDKVELVFGRAESLQPENNTVVVALNDGGSRIIPYDTLVVATGSSAREGMPWKGLTSTEATKRALADLRKRIDAARTIVVAGGGTSGIEIVGELGDLPAVADGSKEVYYAINDKLPLGPPVKDNIRSFIQSSLEKKKIKIVPNVKVTSAVASADGARIVVELSPANKDGKAQTITADVYLPAVGVVPNTAFVPSAMLGPDGRIKQDNYLRAVGHENIFVSGDAGDLEPPNAVAANGQTHHLGKAMQVYFTGGAAMDAYKPNDKFVFLVSLGKDAGTGQAMGMKIFSFIIWYMKSRRMGTDNFHGIVSGTRTLSGNIKG